MQEPAATKAAPKTVTKAPQADVPPVTLKAEPAARAEPRPGKNPAAATGQKCKVKPDSVPWIHLSGGCKNGYAHGKGRARSVDGRRSYAGGFSEGAFSGEGTYDWGDGTRYTGEFRDGQRNGQGAIDYPNKSRYAGQFKDGRYNGMGTYTDADGSGYRGEFRNNRYHGRGTSRQRPC